MRWLLVVVLFLGSPARAEPEVVFGEPAWRAPETIDHVFFHDGGIVVVGQRGDVVRFGRDGTPRLLVEDGRSWFSSATLSGGELILGGDRPQVVELASGRRRPLGRKALAMVVDGGRAVVAERGKRLVVVDMATQKPLHELDRSRGYEQPAIRGQWVVARWGRNAAIWELASGKRHGVYALGNGDLFALSPDGTLLVTGSFDGTPRWAVDVYRVADGKRTASVGFSCSPSAAAISPDGKLLALGCDDEIRVVRLPGGELVARADGPGAYVRAMAFSPSSRELAVGGNDHALHLFAAPGWQPVGRVSGSRGDVRGLALAGGFLLSHSWGDASAWLWDARRVQPVLELGGRGREIMAVATDGLDVFAAVTLKDGGQRRAVLERWREGRRVVQRELAMSSFGLSVLVRAVGPMPGGGAWYTEGGRVTLVGADLRALWTSPVPQTAELEIADGDAASADGRLLALRAGTQVTVVDLPGQRVLAAARASCASGRPVVAPDGRRVAALVPGGVIVVDAMTGKQVASLAAAAESETALAWRSAGELVGLFDDRLISWKVDARTATETPARRVRSLLVDGADLYLGRSDGTVWRRPVASLDAGRRLRVRTAPRCPPAGTGELRGMGGFGISGHGGQRGRLDDAGDHEDPASP